MSKKILFFSLFLTLFFVTNRIQAQIYISSDMFEATKLTIKTTVLDEKSKEPLSFASVYLVPKGDTVISHFALSDTTGMAKIPDVTKGSYILHVEYLGYKPFEKEYFFKKRVEELGKIILSQDLEMLEAATVAAAANPIIVKQDTIEYNASSFNVSQNAMLGDLLKKMPGIEVGGGDVKVNGKSVSKITVNGKTFFFDDKSAALNNLPAKVVDKVKVIDKDSEGSQFSGISDQEKEKVMDITLKKEYEKGWFGNAKVQGGYTLAKKEKDDLIDGRGLLYGMNGMVAAYNEKNQLTVVASGNNVSDPNAGVMVMRSVDDDVSSFGQMGGLPSNYQFGANLNSTAIKGLQTDASASYNRMENINMSKSSRTTFVSDNYNLYTNSENENSSFSNTAKASIAIKNANRDKYFIDFRPSFSYSFTHNNSHAASTTSDDTGELNSSDSKKSSDTKNITTNGYLQAGVKELGKKNRSLNLSANYYIYDSKADSKEYSVLSGKKSEIRDLLYDTDSKRNSFSGGLSYVEPLAENWNLSLSLNGSYSRSTTDKLAFDNNTASINDYYSASSDNKYVTGSGRFLAQYRKEKSNIQFGASLQTSMNEIYSKSFGVSTITGKDEWYWDWAPFVQGSFSIKDSRIRMSYRGYSRQPNRNRIMPVLDVSNPASISTGNIYLKPGFNNTFSVGIDKNNKTTFSYFSLSMYGGYDIRTVVTASWFDKNGIRYSVPVNSQKPGVNINGYINYNRPLDKERKFSINGYINPRYVRNVSYQSKGVLDGINTEAFNYSEFMGKFWGDEKGSNFYSGKSGFNESNTTELNLGVGVNLSYKTERFRGGIGYSPNLRFARYSFDPSANLDTRDHRFNSYIEYRTANNWEITTSMNYAFYKGYTYDYQKPQYSWDLQINKDIKAITLSLNVIDILNSTRFRNRTIDENYMEDSFRLVMGRYFLFGIKYNFGKMNASNAQKAQNASWNMLF